MVTKTKGGDVRRLHSKLRASLVTPCSTRRKNRNGKVYFEEQSMDSPDSSSQYSPLSSHAIAHLRDLEEDEEDKEGYDEDIEEDEEGYPEDITAKQRRLRMGLDDKSACS